MTEKFFYHEDPIFGPMRFKSQEDAEIFNDLDVMFLENNNIVVINWERIDERFWKKWQNLGHLKKIIFPGMMPFKFVFLGEVEKIFGTRWGHWGFANRDETLNITYPIYVMHFFNIALGVRESVAKDLQKRPAGSRAIIFHQ